MAALPLLALTLGSLYTAHRRKIQS
jgi:hypothetical protein